MAAGNLGSLVVSLGLDGAAFFSGLTKSEYEARKSMRAIQNSIEEVRSTVSRFVNALGTISGGALTFAGLVSAFEGVKHATIESEQSLFQLNAALKATGGAAGLTAGDLEQLGREIRGSTTFSTEDIRKAETALLRFRDIRRDVFDEAIRQVPNLAFALGIALPEAAQKLGRALEDPTKGLRGLREAGVFLSETQIALAIHFTELGDRAAAQKIVMDAVALSTGGAAKAAMEGLFGVTERLARSFKDLQTAAGKKLFGDNHAEVEGFIGLLERLIARVEKTNLSLKDLFTKPGLLAKTAFDEAAALLGGYQEEPPSPRLAKGKIGGLAPAGFELSTEQDAARQAALDADIARRLDALTIAKFNALKSFAEKSAQFYASDTALQKYHLATQTQNIEFAYSQGKTETAEYYGALKSIAEQAFSDQDRIFTKRMQAEEAITSSVLSDLPARDAARARMAGIIGESTSARLVMHQRLNALEQLEIVAIQKLKDEYVELGASAAEAAGNLSGAAAARFDVANRERRRKFEAEASSFDPTTSALGQFGLNALDAQRQRIIVQNELTSATQRYALVVGAVGIEQARIDLLLQTGAITEIDAINKRSEVAQKYIALQTKLADEQERFAKTLQGPERATALLEVEKLRLGIEQLAAASDVLAKKFSDIFAGSFSTFLTDIVNHTKTVKQAFLDMAKSIEQSISKIAADQVSQQLFGKGGPLGDVGGFFAKMFGGKESGATGAAGADASLSALAGTTGIADTALVGLTASLTAAAGAATMFSISATAGGLSGAFMGSGAGGLGAILGPGGLFGFAEGGNPPVGKISLVGEKGPELFVPKQAGTIIPFTALPATSVAKVRQMIDFGGFFADGGDPPLGKISVVGEKGPELFVPRQAGTVIPFTVTPTKAAVTIPDFAGLFSPGESAAETKTPDFRSPKLQDFHSPFFAAPSMAVPDFGVKLVPAAPDFSFKFSLVAEKTPPFSGRTAPSLTTKASFGGVFNPPLAGPVPGFGFPPFKFSLAAPVFSAASHPPVVSVFLPTPLSIGSSASPSTKVPDFGGHKPPSIGFAVPAKNTMDFGFHPHQFSIHHGASVITRLVEPVFSTVSPSLATKLPDFGFRLGDGRTLTSAGIVPDFHFSLVAEKSPALLAGSAPIKVPDFGFRSFLQDFGGFFAGGGDPPVGKFSMVGEHGPELFMPKQAGTIIPFDQVRGRRSSKSIEIGAINVNVPASTSGPSATQIANRTVRELQRSAAKG